MQPERTIVTLGSAYYVPWLGSKISGTIRGYIADICLHQTFANKTKEPLECLFSFPLPLVNFVGTITGVTIVNDGKESKSTLLEKEQAEAKYDDAIAEGRTAVLAQTSDDTRDEFKWFNISVGVVQPGKEVIVRVELAVQLYQKEIVIPRKCVSPQANDSLHQMKTLEVFIEAEPNASMKIKGLRCNLYPNLKLSSQIAFTVPSESSIKDIIFTLDYEDTTEVYPQVEVSDDSAIMLPIVPVITNQPNGMDMPLDNQYEVIFIVDRSGSMDGTKMTQTKQMLQIFLRSLPDGCLFNIISFGSYCESVFGTSAVYSQHTLQTASEVVDNMTANMSGTNMLRPLTTVFKGKSESTLKRRIFVLTDGAVDNREDCILCVQQNISAKDRIFSFGIGDGADMRLVHELATAGRGQSEFVSNSDRMDEKIIVALNRALQQEINNLKLSITGVKDDSIALASAGPLYQGERTCLYAIYQGKINQDTMIEVIGEWAGNSVVLGKYSCSVVTNGRLAHAIAAYHLIKEAERNQQKSRATELSLRYGVLSQYTSFVVVDKTSNIGIATEGSITKWIRSPPPGSFPPPCVAQALSYLGNCSSATSDLETSLVESLVGGMYSTRDTSIVRPQRAPVKVGLIAARRSRVDDSVQLRKAKREELLQASRTTVKDKSPAPVQITAESLLREAKDLNDSHQDWKIPPSISNWKNVKGYTIPLDQRLSATTGDEKQKSFARLSESLYVAERTAREEIANRSQVKQSLTERKLHSFVQLQNADGSWRLEDIANYLSLDITTLVQKLPDNRSEPTVWATALAMAILELHFADKKATWGLIMQKATQWLRKNIRDRDTIDQTVSCAKQILTA